MAQHWVVDRSIEILPEWLDALPGVKVVLRCESARIDDSVDSVVWCRCRSGEDLGAVFSDILVPSNSKMVVLADTPDERMVTDALALGASGCCNSYAAAEVIRQVATVIENGGLWVGRTLMQSLVKSTERSLRESDIKIDVFGGLQMLSEREMQVALQVGRGASNKEIAGQLSITERTVKAHLSAIFEKLGLRDRLQLSLRVNARAP